MYPALTPRKSAKSAQKIVGGIVMCVVCLTVAGIVVYAIKKLAENEMEKTDKGQPEVRTFTTNEAFGRHGPHKLKYTDPRMLREVKLERGIQIWTVPKSGIWELEARGASGADGLLMGGKRMRGGWGALVRGKFVLSKGQVLKILIGQEGSRDILDPKRPGSGGGGTFVVKSDWTPLLVAGGGGGGGIPQPAAFQSEGKGGRTNDKRHKNDITSGHAGSGGKLLDTSTKKLIADSKGGHKVIAGAGGGFHGDGLGYRPQWGGMSFKHGGTGGEPEPRYTSHTHGTFSVGGFGGGGASGLLPGGGGGYSGGGVQGCWLQCDPGKEEGIAGGGSSYNKGLHPYSKGNTHKGQGLLYAKFLTGDQTVLDALNLESKQ